MKINERFIHWFVIVIGQQVDLESVATHVVAALFKEFLRNIPGGLLPSSRYTVLVASNDCKDIDDRAIRISRSVVCVCVRTCVCTCVCAYVRVCAHVHVYVAKLISQS